MTCKDCIKHDKCVKQNKIMLTVDDICELVYQHGVEKSCNHFIKADKVCKDCINYDECLACKVNAKECLLFKNKADFVEVVKCKDCVKDNRFDCPLCYIEKQTMQFINHDAEFYCGFGERRDT